jgi:hypothetical protein
MARGLRADAPQRLPWPLRTRRRSGVASEGASAALEHGFGQESLIRNPVDAHLDWGELFSSGAGDPDAEDRRGLIASLIGVVRIVDRPRLAMQASTLAPIRFGSTGGFDTEA